MVKIINITRNTIVASHAKLAVSFFDRAFGLLNKNNPRSLIFKTRFGLHTFGLKSDIDILVLDANGLVKKLGKEVPANRFFFYNPVFSTVIELESGAIEKSLTKLDDKIIIE